MNRYETISPLGEPAIKAKWVPRHFDTLNGKTVCQIWNGGFRGQVTFPIIREMLQKRYPDIKVIPYTEFPTTPLHIHSVEEMAKKLEAVRIALLEKGCDAVISAQGG